MELWTRLKFILARVAYNYYDNLRIILRSRHLWIILSQYRVYCIELLKLSTTNSPRKCLYDLKENISKTRGKIWNLFRLNMHLLCFSFSRHWGQCALLYMLYRGRFCLGLSDMKNEIRFFFLKQKERKKFPHAKIYVVLALVAGGRSWKSSSL